MVHKFGAGQINKQRVYETSEFVYTNHNDKPFVIIYSQINQEIQIIEKNTLESKSIQNINSQPDFVNISDDNTLISIDSKVYDADSLDLVYKFDFVGNVVFSHDKSIAIVNYCRQYSSRCHAKIFELSSGLEIYDLFHNYSSNVYFLSNGPYIIFSHGMVLNYDLKEQVCYFPRYISLINNYIIMDDSYTDIRSYYLIEENSCKKITYIKNFYRSKVLSDWGFISFIGYSFTVVDSNSLEVISEIPKTEKHEEIIDISKNNKYILTKVYSVSTREILKLKIYGIPNQ